MCSMYIHDCRYSWHGCSLYDTEPTDTNKSLFFTVFLIKKRSAKLYVWTLRLKIPMRMGGSLSLPYSFSLFSRSLYFCLWFSLYSFIFPVQILHISMGSCDLHAFEWSKWSGVSFASAILVWFYHLFQFGELFYPTDKYKKRAKS